MGVDRLRLKDRQPFYHVLVSDGSNRYAAQENLVPADPAAAGDVDHPEVGKHFARRTGAHYEPNQESAACYPGDDQVRAEKFSGQ